MMEYVCFDQNTRSLYVLFQAGLVNSLIFAEYYTLTTTFYTTIRSTCKKSIRPISRSFHHDYQLRSVQQCACVKKQQKRTKCFTYKFYFNIIFSIA